MLPNLVKSKNARVNYIDLIIFQKAEPFSWRPVEDELAVRYIENLDV